MRAHSKTPPTGPGTIPAAVQSKYMGAFHPVKATLRTMRAHSAQSQPAARGRPAGSRRVRHYSWGGTRPHQDESASSHRHTKGSGDPVGKRILSAIAAITTAALLSSCTPATSQAPETDADVASTTQAELPPGFYLGEEFIEIGEFNPNKVELIDLCEEIPDEVLLEAGMVKNSGSSRQNRNSINCFLEPSISDFSADTFLLASDSFTESELDSAGYLIAAEVSEKIPTAFLYHLGSDENFACNAAVSTTKSLMSVSLEDYSSDVSQEHLCNQALNTLETIYVELRGK